MSDTKFIPWILGGVLFALVVYDTVMIPVFVKKDEEYKKIREDVEDESSGARTKVLSKYKVM
jgi:hypothetical protein